MSTNCEFRFSTLNERTLHRAVKDYLEPDRRCQEVAVAGMVADIFREGQLWEVQTGSVTPLGKKLLRLPEEYPVTIVLPIVREKTICTLSAEGELLSRRRSPKKGSWWESYYQLPRLLPLAARPGIRLRLLLVDAEEYRAEIPTGRVGRTPCRRLDRVPTAFGEELDLAFPGELWKLLPPGLPDPFTREELQKHTRLSARGMSGGLSALMKLGVVCPAGKTGRKTLYKRTGTEGVQPI